jgi:hypothetical protein
VFAPNIIILIVSIKTVAASLLPEQFGIIYQRQGIKKCVEIKEVMEVLTFSFD